ncbi:hypothetical protein LTR37_018722 [Vermiconidia calcicola]|uniref:Uncharacterized protein n=1 Tax=Vermiconidia calcicola TaxID=1690605 RepID=A0ACC3MG29_9PEZI|nr:hypothetical protein LTR37_018722 [Vermiconidia calcicola]
MSSSQDSQHFQTVRAKKTNTTQVPPLSNPGHSGPTTFFLRSERDVEKSSSRGRKASRESDAPEEDSMTKTSMSESGTFGVQSLEDTIGLPAASDYTLLRTMSNASEASVDANTKSSNMAGRKRKVHPLIAAAGQRIISSEHAPRNGSPVSHHSTDSPVRPHQRRGSVSSSINLSQPITPLKLSPQPQSAMPSTPRSGSPKSFRLSDEEASVASDSNSQAIQSSSEEDDDSVADGAKAQALPQLVMPSLAMPARRPFTERGRRMGRLKVMVVGAKGVGKTSLIQSICRVCEDVVHLDSMTGSTNGDSLTQNFDSAGNATRGMVEIGASTRPYPPWWTDFESRRQLHRRNSIGDGVLERNITFLDTPGFYGGKHVEDVLQHFKRTLSRMGTMAKMSDSELVYMLSGEGGVQVDVVIYLFDAAVTSPESPEHLQLDYEQAELLLYLCKWTNVIPVIGRADTMDPTELMARKKQLMEMFEGLSAQPHITRPVEDDDSEPVEPFAISSALGDDTDTLDASILMSSTYLQPLVPSELEVFVTQLLDPESMARLRHLSAIKFLLWRQENIGSHLDLEKQLLLNPRPSSPGLTSTGAESIPGESSKVLVPHATSSYFRSPSPSENDSSAPPPLRNASPSAPFRQVRLAKWAQDLQRSLDNERRRYKQMYTNSTIPSSSEEWTPPTTTDSEKALSRPSRGRLGGDLSIIDPRDPLGVLAFGQAFRRRGWLALQVAGSCGLLGAVAWWVVRNWEYVQDLLGLDFGQGRMVQVTAVPAPTRNMFDVPGWRGTSLRGFFGWER